MKLKSTSPNEITSEIRLLFDLLGLDEKDSIFLNYTKEEEFEADFDNCHINNMIKKKLFGGETVYGWIIWENKLANFVEANFHSVWEDDKGKLWDITPKRDNEQTILFVKDPFRTIEQTQYKNYPALITYDNFTIMDGNIENGLKKIITVITTNKFYEYGLAN